MSQPSSLTALSAHEKRQLAAHTGAVVGVDAGKFAHTLVVRPAGGADAKPVSFPVTREGFETALTAIHAAAPGVAPRDILVGIEFAGTYGSPESGWNCAAKACGSGANALSGSCGSTGCRALICGAAGRAAPPGRTRTTPRLRTWSSATSARPRPTGCGWPT